jgi:hypothetical protein
VTLLWWILFMGPAVAVEIVCVRAVLRSGKVALPLVVGGGLLLFVTPVFGILLTALMAQIDPGLHGGPGTGIGYAIPMFAIAFLIIHVVIIGLARAYLASLRAEARRAGDKPSEK